jgi:hypothetical protein
MVVHSAGTTGFRIITNSGATWAFGRHDASRDEATVVIEVVPPDPKPIASLMMATNVELPGNCSGNEKLDPESIVRSAMARISGCSAPVGTSRSWKGAVPPVHWTVAFAHWVGGVVKLKVNACATETTTRRERRAGKSANIVDCSVRALAV